MPVHTDCLCCSLYCLKNCPRLCSSHLHHQCSPLCVGREIDVEDDVSGVLTSPNMTIFWCSCPRRTLWTDPKEQPFAVSAPGSMGCGCRGLPLLFPFAASKQCQVRTLRTCRGFWEFESTLIISAFTQNRHQAGTR